MSQSQQGPQPWLSLSAFQQTKDFRNPKYHEFEEWDDFVSWRTRASQPVILSSIRQHEASPDKIQRIESLAKRFLEGYPLEIQSCKDLNEVENKKSTGFFELPAELRNRIYSELLQARDDVDLWYSLGEYVWRFWSPDRVLIPCPIDAKILATCRAINKEATPILYGANSFVSNYLTFTQFFEMIGPKMAQLRHVKIWFSVTEPCIPKQLDQASGLKILELRISPPYGGTTEPTPNRFVGYLCHWIKAQRLARAGSEKKDPTKVLRLVPQRDFSVQVVRLLPNGEECVAEAREMLERKL